MATAAGDDAAVQKRMRDLFEKADVATTLKNTPKAFKTYEDILALAATQGQKKFALDSAAKAREAEKKILDEAGKPLDTVQKAITDGKAADATAALTSFQKDYGALIAVAADLKNRFDKLQGAPEVKKELQEQEVQKNIQLGDNALQGGDYLAAARCYRKAALLYPDTAASAAATEKLTQLQANPKAAQLLKPE